MVFAIDVKYPSWTSENENRSAVFDSLWTPGWVLQARTLEWIAVPFPRGSSQPRDLTQVSCIAGGFFTSWATREAQEYWSGGLSLLQQIFLTQESNQGLLQCRWILYQLRYQGIQKIVYIMCYAVLSHVQLFVIPWTVANQAPLSMGILQARILEWVAPSSKGSSQLRDRTQVSGIAGRFSTIWVTRKAHHGPSLGFISKCE